MRYIKKLNQISENTKPKGNLNNVFINTQLDIKSLWRAVEKDNIIPFYLVELNELIKDKNSDFFKNKFVRKMIYDLSYKHNNLKEFASALVTSLVELERQVTVSKYNIKRFNGKNIILEEDGYTLFKIDNFDEIKDFDKMSAICYSKKYFDIYNELEDIHFLFKNDEYIYSFSIRDGKVTVLTTPGNTYVKMNELSDIDFKAYEIIKSLTID